MIRRPLFIHASLIAIGAAALYGLGWAENIAWFALIGFTAVGTLAAFAPASAIRKAIHKTAGQPAPLRALMPVFHVLYVAFAAAMGWFWLAAFYGVAYWIARVRYATEAKALGHGIA